MECQLISIGSQLAPARQAGRQPAQLQPPISSPKPLASSRLVAGDWWLETGGWGLETGGWKLVAGDWKPMDQIWKFSDSNPIDK